MHVIFLHLASKHCSFNLITWSKLCVLSCYFIFPMQGATACSHCLMATSGSAFPVFLTVPSVPQTFLVSLLWTLNVIVNKRNYFSLAYNFKLPGTVCEGMQLLCWRDRQTGRHCRQTILWRVHFPSTTAGSISWQLWAVSSYGVCFCYGEAPSPRLCLQQKPSLDMERKDLSILFQGIRFRWADWWQNPHKWAVDSSVLFESLTTLCLIPSFLMNDGHWCWVSILWCICAYVMCNTDFSQVLAVMNPK